MRGEGWRLAERDGVRGEGRRLAERDGVRGEGEEKEGGGVHGKERGMGTKI